MAATSPIASAPPRRRPIPELEGGHPILGHLSTFKNDRTGLLLGLAKTHPDIAKMSLGIARKIIVLGSPAMVSEVLTAKSSSFVKAPGLTVFLRPALGDGLLTSEKAFHTRQRRLLAPAFAPKRVASYGETMVTRADRFAAALEEGASLDFADAMMRLTFEIVGKTLFDAEVGSDASAVGEALTVAMSIAMEQLGSIVPIPPAIPTPLNLKGRRAVKRLDSVVYRIIEQRRAQTGDRGDVLSMLLAAKDDDGTTMSDRQIRDEAMTLFLAGHETTANALSWTFYLLAKHPEARARLEDEVDALGHVPSVDDLARLPYTLAVFKEAMRLYPPAYLLGRRVTEDVVIGEHLFPKNAIVFINILGIHRRADLWPDPQRFLPERFLDDKEKELPRCVYMPFGAGPRVCIGNHFAAMEGHLVLAAIARRARFELVSAEPPKLEPLVTLRPKGGLPVRVSLRRDQ